MPRPIAQETQDFDAHPRDGKCPRKHRGLGCLLIALCLGLTGTAYPQVSTAVANAVQMASVARGMPVVAPLSAYGPLAERKQKFSRKERNLLKADVNRIGNRGIGQEFNLYSPEAEMALGRDLADAVEQSSRTVRDPAIDSYLKELCQRLVVHSDAKVPFTVTVLDDNDINGFALPGGYLYLNSGLIGAAHNEAELAAVMAHEIAHVAARHASRNASKAQVWSLASLPLVFVGGPAGMAIQQVKGFALPLTLLKFSRDAEREADMLGLQYQYAAGYDPATFVDFFERLETYSHERKGLAKAFSTHPMSSERVRRAEQEIRTTLPARDEYIVNTSDFDQAKARLAEILSAAPVTTATTDVPVLR